MEYFYLKIGEGNGLARDWLAGKNPLHRPAAVIWFDNYSQQQYRQGKGKAEPRSFWQRGQKKFYNETLMVVVHDGEIWILRPAGRVRFLRSEKAGNARRTPKVMPVKVLAHRNAKDVSPVLTCITANQYLTRGTFRRIHDDWGNYKAIDCVVGSRQVGDHWEPAKQGAGQLLECLASTELETLIAKLFEAHGCFVPAYRGGAMKDIDLFVHNDGDRAIHLGGLQVPPKQRVSVQIRRWSNDFTKPSCVDYLVGLDVKGHNSFDADWILARVKECPPVASWLRRSLDWLPRTFLSAFGL
jgi:hypothetical protein